VEGENTGEWVLVDMGDMIVHIMQPAIRAYYRLEEIWGEKEVKFGAAKRISKRSASEPEDADAAPKKASGRHLTVSKAIAAEGAPKKPAARKKPAAKPAAASAEKTATSKAATKKSAADKEPAGKTVKVAATKGATTAAAAKKAAAARSTGAGAAVKRSPAKAKPAK
jgi:ribosome-associated protein